MYARMGFGLRKPVVLLSCCRHNNDAKTGLKPHIYTYATFARVYILILERVMWHTRNGEYPRASAHANTPSSFSYHSVYPYVQTPTATATATANAKAEAEAEAEVEAEVAQITFSTCGPYMPYTPMITDAVSKTEREPVKMLSSSSSSSSSSCSAWSRFVTVAVACACAAVLFTVRL